MVPTPVTFLLTKQSESLTAPAPAVQPTGSVEAGFDGGPKGLVLVQLLNVTPFIEAAPHPAATAASSNEAADEPSSALAAAKAIASTVREIRALSRYPLPKSRTMPTNRPKRTNPKETKISICPF